MAKEHSLIFLIGSKIASNFSVNMVNVSRNIQNIDNKLVAYNKTQQQIAKFKGLKTSLQDDKQRAVALQTELNNMARTLRNTTNPSNELTRSFEAKKREMQALQERIRRNGEELNRYRSQLRDSGVDTRNLSQESIRLRREYQEQQEAVA